MITLDSGMPLHSCCEMRVMHCMTYFFYNSGLYKNSSAYIISNGKSLPFDIVSGRNVCVVVGSAQS